MQWNPLGKPRDWSDRKSVGGIEDIPESERQKFCLDPAHEPPTHIVIPHGKRLRHICPSCGREFLIYPTEAWL